MWNQLNYGALGVKYGISCHMTQLIQPINEIIRLFNKGGGNLRTTMAFGMLIVPTFGKSFMLAWMMACQTISVAMYKRLVELVTCYPFEGKNLPSSW